MYPINFLRRGARSNADGIAVEDGTRGLSYTALSARVAALAAGLQARLPAPGARIGVCAYNTIEHMTAILAVFAAGHVWVALNPRLGKPDLAAIVDCVELDAVIVDEDCLALLDLPDIPVFVGHHTTGTGGQTTLENLAQRHAGEAPRAHNQPLNAPQTIKFTGGSTGRPKGVVQPYRCINALVVSYQTLFRFDRRDVNMCAAPLTHGSAHYMLPILAVGGRHVLVREPKAPALIDAFSDMGCTTAFMPPTMIYNLLDEPALARADLSHVRHLHYGAAPMAPDRIREARERLNGALEVIYGQTEAPMLITGMTAAEFDDDRNLLSVGREGPVMSVAIMAEDGEILPAGETGEIVCRGDLMMSRYLDDPAETEKAVVDGWLHTGDAGILDDRGYLFIKDRLRDMIISGGFNVYPTEVEGALSRHPAVRDCIVFGVPDDKWGERVEVAVVVDEAQTLDSEDLKQFGKAQLGSVRTPKTVHFVDQLPKSAVGKVLRREARRLFAPK